MRDALLSFCQGAFPGRGNLDIADLTSITDGWECDVYSFGLIGNGGTRRELILRIYQGGEAARTAAAEFAILEELRRASYPVPEVFALATDHSPLGKPFVVMEKIEGTVLGPRLRLPSGEPEPDGFRRFCGLLARLHALDWRTVAPDNPYFPIRGGLDRWIAWARGLIATFGTSDYDEALDWLVRHARRVTPRDLVIVHQDFHPWNVLVRPGGELVVIDWTQPDLLDPRLDLAWTALLLSAAFGPSARDRAIVEYERVAGTVADFEVFEVAAAVKRLASITLSLGGGAEKLGMRPGAEEQILKQIHHLQVAYGVFQDRAGLRIGVVEDILAKVGP
jgi:aminoglycoside phosphotransferase (APT) family kinase protein